MSVSNISLYHLSSMSAHLFLIESSAQCFLIRFIILPSSDCLRCSTCIGSPSMTSRIEFSSVYHGNEPSLVFSSHWDITTSPPFSKKHSLTEWFFISFTNISEYTNLCRAGTCEFIHSRSLS